MQRPHRALDDPPGGLLAWIVIAVEFATFSLGFVWIVSARRDDPDGFAALRSALDLRVGVALTGLLLASGAVAAHGVARYRRGDLADARRAFVAAALLGVGFLGAKATDWVHLAGAGIRLGASDAADLYLLGTGFHAAHVVVGVGLLLAVAGRVGRARFDDEETAVAGSVAFWHFCDVAWFFLFPLLQAPA